MLIEQTKTKQQETLDFELKKQMETFYYSPSMNTVEEGKRLKSVTTFEATNFVFNITDENNSFSNTLPDHWDSEDGEEFIKKINGILGLDIKALLYCMKKKLKKRYSRRNGKQGL